MCLHASFMPAPMCSICTPPPKVVKPERKERTRTPRTSNLNPTARLARNTNEFLITSELVDMLCDSSTDPAAMKMLLTLDILPAYGGPNDPGCIYYRPPRGTTWERLIPIRLKDTDREVVTSAVRAAWAAANANQDRALETAQNAVHLCGAEQLEDIRLCCVNPAHIVGA